MKNIVAIIMFLYSAILPAQQNFPFRSEICFASFPASSFTFTQSGICMNETVVFTNLSTPSGLTYNWTFGDGSSASSVQNPTHIYSKPGTFQIVLTATDSCGRFHNSQKIVTVIPSTSTYNANCCSQDSSLFNPNGYNVVQNITIASQGDLTQFLNMFIGNNIIVMGTLKFSTFGQIYILSGVTIQFGPLGTMIIDRGVTVDISNSTLTGLTACGTLWQGAEVWGNGNKTHNLNDQQYQGKLIAKNAIVRRAHIGVLVGRREPKCFPPPPQYCANPPCLVALPCKKIPINNTYGGGILITDNNMRFDTNGVAIRFTPFYKPNASKIQNTQFIGGTLPDPGYTTGNAYTYPNSGNTFFGSANPTGRAAVGLWQWSVKKVFIKNNSFRNIQTAAESYDSKYNITACSFKKHENGIRVFNTNSSIDNGRVISQCVFDSITSMVWMDGGRVDVVRNSNVFGDSTFLTPQQINQYGVLLINSSNHRVTNNRFNRLGWALLGTNSGTGGGYAGYENGRNVFTRCNTGIFTFGDNTKLTLRCNNHNNTDTTQYGGSNWFNWGTLATQGSFNPNPLLTHRFAAGNRFAPIDRKQINEFNWGDTTTYNYFHHSDTALHRPTPAGALTNNNLFNVGVPSQGDASCIPPDPCNVGPAYCSPLTDSIPIWLNTLQQQYDAILSMLDKGNANVLIAAINKQPPMQPGQLKNLLLAHTPLSDAMLLALLRRNPSLTCGTLKEVLLPNSPVSPPVRTVLDSLILTWGNQCSGAAKEIIAAQVGISGNNTLTSIEREMEFLNNWRQENMSIFFEKLLSGTDDLSADSLAKADSLKQLAIDFLENESLNAPTEEGKINALQMLFSVYLADSNLSAAAAKLSLIPDSTLLLQQWKTISSILLSLALDSNTVFEIDSAQEQTIRQIAGTTMLIEGLQTMGLAVSNAQSILRLVYGEEFPVIIALPSAKTSQQNTIEEAQPPSSDFRLPSSNFLGNNIPNPFKESTIIPFALSFGTQKATLRISDAVGRIIEEIPLKPDDRAVELETEGWGNGVYFYSLVIDGNAVQTKRMVLLK